MLLTEQLLSVQTVSQREPKKPRTTRSSLRRTFILQTCTIKNEKAPKLRPMSRLDLDFNKIVSFADCFCRTVNDHER